MKSTRNTAIRSLIKARGKLFFPGTNDESVVFRENTIFSSLGTHEQDSFVVLMLIMYSLTALSSNRISLRSVLFEDEDSIFAVFCSRGKRLRRTVVPSDSGYLTTESSEKTIGDVSISRCCSSCIVRRLLG